MGVRKGLRATALLDSKVVGVILGHGHWAGLASASHQGLWGESAPGVLLTDLNPHPERAVRMLMLDLEQSSREGTVLNKNSQISVSATALFPSLQLGTTSAPRQERGLARYNGAVQWGAGSA